MDFTNLYFIIFLAVGLGILKVITLLKIKPATTNRLFSLVLIAMSLVFICCYNLPSAALLILVGLLTHFMGLLIFNSTDAKQKKLLLIIALVILVGLLFAFKYTAFVPALP